MEKMSKKELHPLVGYFFVAFLAAVLALILWVVITNVMMVNKSYLYPGRVCSPGGSIEN